MKNLSRAVLLILFALLAAPPALQAGSDRYAAIAFSPSAKKWGFADSYATKGEAIARALSECGYPDAHTSWCRNEWIALAISDKSSGGWGEGWGKTADAARREARRQCLSRNPDARIVACVSACGH